MSKLTVIVTVKNETDDLKKTLESLCEQSTEEFEVLIVLRGDHAETIALAKSYCEEYVGFSMKETDNCLPAAARNLGVSLAETPLLLFMAAGDYLAPDSVEAILAAAEKHNADILLPRLYISGENEPYYEPWREMLAVSASVDRFDNAFLHTLDFAGCVYRKKFFDLYSLRFPETPVFYVAAFTAECVFKCDARISGVAGAIYDDASGVFRCGFKDGTAPSGRNLAVCRQVYDEILSTVKTLLEEESEEFDGDEFVYQEMVYLYFSVLTDRFYRYFWYLTDEDIAALQEQYDKLTVLMTKERKEKIEKSYADLRLPAMYITSADAAALPMVSLLGDFRETAGLDAFLASLYNGRFPFFELFLRESARADVPECWRSMPNLHFVPDAGFFAAARSEAGGVQINVKDPAPLDPKVLPELATVKAPHSVYQYIFAAKRKKYGAKTALKKKGANIK